MHSTVSSICQRQQYWLEACFSAQTDVLLKAVDSRLPGFWCKIPRCNNWPNSLDCFLKPRSLRRQTATCRALPRKQVLNDKTQSQTMLPSSAAALQICSTVKASQQAEPQVWGAPAAKGLEGCLGLITHRSGTIKAQITCSCLSRTAISCQLDFSAKASARHSQLWNQRGVHSASAGEVPACAPKAHTGVIWVSDVERGQIL